MTPEEKYLAENDEHTLEEMLVAIDNFHEIIYASNRTITGIIKDHDQVLNFLLIVIGALFFLNVIISGLLMYKGIL